MPSEECYGPGHLPWRKQLEDSEEAESGGTQQRTLQLENTMQVTTKRAGTPLQRHSDGPWHPRWRPEPSHLWRSWVSRRLGRCLSRRLRVEETFPLGRFLPPYAILFCFELLLDVFLRNFVFHQMTQKSCKDNLWHKRAKLSNKQKA